MMKKSVLSLRGLKVCALSCESKDQNSLKQQFQRLGVTSTFLAELPDPVLLAGFDIVMFDSDHASVATHGREWHWPDVPRIAILGTETPSRLQWILDQNVSGYIRKPVRYEGVLAACVLAYASHQSRQALQERVGQLETRIKARKFVFSAQLKLMNECGLNADDAYSRLRKLAMQRQISVERLSVELLGQGFPEHDVDFR